MTLSRLLVLLFALVLAGCATRETRDVAMTKKVYTAEETSRTIDLTNPPRDVWDRIRRGFAIPNLNTDLTQRWTQYYAERPQSVLRMSERASRYLYHIVEELERRGLPTELALLPFVESAYNPTALSSAKAAGLWQFIPSTGRHYNLTQDWWRDERRDPIASTNAALEYLSYLYDFQGDWYLSLASYNWGEGAVRRAMERNADAGLPADYHSLRMPDETRNYVPKLQAIKNIIARPEKYGMQLPHVPNRPYFVKVQKERDIDIDVAARLAEMSLEEFQQLNPSYNRPIIRGDHKPVLLLPADRADIFHANLAAYQGKLSSWQTYRSRKGESYAAIAKRHGISLTDLRAANGLGKRGTVASAQVLLVPTPRTGDQPMRGGIQLASLAPVAGAVPSSTARSSKDVVVLQRGANVRIHTVRKGDTLFSVARRYQTSVTNLRRLNNLKTDKLALGARLRIPGTHVRG